MHVAGLHHASTTVKLQALSKKATQRLLLTSEAAAQLQQQSSHKRQQPPAKKQKQQQQKQQEQGVEGLLDAATGAFVHGTEDDLPRVGATCSVVPTKLFKLSTTELVAVMGFQNSTVLLGRTNADVACSVGTLDSLRPGACDSYQSTCFQPIRLYEL